MGKSGIEISDVEGISGTDEPSAEGSVDGERHKDMLRRRAACASERRDCERRIEARVWKVEGSLGETRRASVMYLEQ